MKVILNPKHFHVRVKPEDGTIWLTHEKFRQAIIPIKDVTSDVLFALCADLSADNVTQKTERSILFSDGMECKITVEMVQSSATAPAPEPALFDGHIDPPC